MRTDNICLVKQDREAPSGGILACWWLQLLPSADVMPPLALPRVFPGWGVQCSQGGRRGECAGPEAPSAEMKSPGAVPVLP